MNLTNKKVVVVGSGVSGIGATGLLLREGAEVILYDGNEKLTEEAVREKLVENIGKEAASAKIIVGEIGDDIIQKTDLCVISPGVPIDSKIVLKFKAQGVTIWGEIELAYNYEKGKVFAITGTNGKTTTTTLVGEIFKQYNEKTFVVGNIGNSYTGEVKKTCGDSITVAEISSFQLETICDFKPVGTAILNITPDHLNRHYTMENYISVKESITKNQDENGYCVLNLDDKVLADFGKTIKNAVYFSRKSVPQRGAYLDGDNIMYVEDNTETFVMSVKDMHLFGNHNYENVMAAIAMTRSAGVPFEIIVPVIRDFMGVEHRIEYVRDLNGVTYYNDSKGTNPDSSIKALEAMSRPTLLIAGGYDKHNEFDEFIDAFDGKVKLLVLIGSTRELIKETAERHGFTKIVMAQDLKEAVEICAKKAEYGDVVLLSPACASWDMFTSYEQRGRMFKNYVNMLM